MDAAAVKPRTIALTGGIGSGKSTVAIMLRDWGVPVLDLDGLGHVCLHDAAVKRRVQDAFGQDVLDEQGEVLRSRLADKAFQDAASTARLNAIMHPAIIEKEREWVQQQDAPYVVIEASVVLESDGAARMDGVLAVMAPLPLRQERVMQRGRQDAQRFAQIVARQCDDRVREEKSDWLLWNEGNLVQLQEKARCWHEQRMMDFH